MIAAAPLSYLDSYLAPLADYLARQDVTDIWINRPHEVWLELLGGAIEQHAAPDLSSLALTRLARQIAALSAQGISREHPLLAASLPDGSRVQIVLPPATRRDIAIAIRRHIVSDLTLEAWRTTPHPRAAPVASASTGADGSSIAPDDTITLLRRAVRDRQTILISGSTSTGKTTFLNSLFKEVPQHERLIVIEDTPELQIMHENAVGLLAVRGNLGEAAATADDLLIASLRMRPDRIILGEIRGKEALTFLRAVNTGHPGSMSTIHADTPEGAIEQLALLALQGGIGMGWDDLIAYVRRSVGCVVQLSREGGTRVVQDVRRFG